ncbi:MAG: hypothetical protein WD278_00210 [Pirellulales bacterium]
MLVLSQFILRLSFGLALAMAATRPRQISSGYYRNNLYVLLGLNALAALVAWAAPEQGLPIWPPMAAAAASYLGAAFWLYEKPRPGKLALIAVSVFALCGAWLLDPPAASQTAIQRALTWLDPVSGGLLLGTTMAAMLLGHWYLNEPGMPLGPLWRLLVWMAAALFVRGLVCGLGLVLAVSSGGADSLGSAWRLFVGLRWLGGIGGTAVLIAMAWQTLKVPNTQSATGILYVAVIATYLGELTSLLLSGESAWPL